jgi:hypothetical protein
MVGTSPDAFASRGFAHPTPLDIQQLPRIRLQHLRPDLVADLQLCKSLSQRSGVITGQSEPNSILSCKMLLM